MQADPTLKNARIKIALNRLRVAAYPGGGMHRVLLHFFAQNQVPGKTENLHFWKTHTLLKTASLPPALSPPTRKPISPEE